MASVCCAVLSNQLIDIPTNHTCTYTLQRSNTLYVHFFKQIIGYSGIVQLLYRATSTINRITFVPWSDSDLAELRKVTPLPQEFEDPNGLPQLSSKQKSNFMGWMRPYDICDNPRMVHLISSFSIKQVNEV